MEAFAQWEGLERATQDKLLRMVDELWEKSADGRGSPPTQGDGYARYSNGRIAEFKGAMLKRARNLLTADQVERLAKEGGGNG